MFRGLGWCVCVQSRVLSWCVCVLVSAGVCSEDWAGVCIEHRIGLVCVCSEQRIELVCVCVCVCVELVCVQSRGLGWCVFRV